MRMINADLIQYEPMLSAKGNGMYEDVMVAYKSQIDDLPTIEERKKGQWIDMWDKNDPYISSRGRCSICGRESDRPLGDYCKWCGADMMSLPEPHKEGTDNQITVCPMCPDCPDNCPLGSEMRGDDHEND